MTYQDMLRQLDGLGRFGMKLTLDRIGVLLDLLDHPERRLRAVHVAGTNGKGSTVAMLDSILRAAGYQTGRWTSPHLCDFRERIALNGRPAADDVLLRSWAKVWAAVEQIKHGPAGHPTQFEAGTALAFLVLAEAQPDLALIEVGLGGRYDSTNVLDPLVTIVTRLALDHTDRLGGDLSAIAAEKAGIIKPGRPLVSAPQDSAALEVLLSTAAEQKAPVRLVGRDFTYRLDRVGLDGTYCSFQGKRRYEGVRVGLPGAHQAMNAAVAVAAAEEIDACGYPISPAAVGRGLADTVWPGRLEIVRRQPMVVLDGAHNPDGMAALARALREVFGRDKVDLLLGFLANRPLMEMIEPLQPLTRRVVVTTVPGGTAPGAPLDLIAGAFPPGIQVVQAPQPAVALRESLAGLPSDGLLCVCGSLYLIGAIRPLLVESNEPLL